MDIIIYTTKEVLEHKKGKDGYQEYYWTLARLPKQLEIGDKIYFACEKFIQGYFIIEEININLHEIIWYKQTWKELKKKIPAKSFQGFKYANKVPELK